MLLSENEYLVWAMRPVSPSWSANAKDLTSDEGYRKESQALVSGGTYKWRAGGLYGFLVILAGQLLSMATRRLAASTDGTSPIEPIKASRSNRPLILLADSLLLFAYCGILVPDAVTVN